MYRRYCSEAVYRPVTPVPSLEKSDDISPVTTSTRSPVTPTACSYLLSYTALPVKTPKEHRPSHKKTSHPKMSRPPPDKPLPALPQQAMHSPEVSFMNWDSTDDEGRSKRAIQKVKQALKPNRKPLPQAVNTTLRKRVIAHSPDNVENATPRSPPRATFNKLPITEPLMSTAPNTTKPKSAPCRPSSGNRPKSREKKQDTMPPTSFKPSPRPLPIKAPSDRSILQARPHQIPSARPKLNPPTSHHTSYRHSYDESSATAATFASIRQLAGNDRPRPSFDASHPCAPEPTNLRRAPPPLPTHFVFPSYTARPGRPGIQVSRTTAFLANEAREFTPPDTPTSTATTGSGNGLAGKPKKFRALFQSLKEKSSFKDLRRGST